MIPHRSFKLHKLPRSLEHPYGVYRLSHGSMLSRVSLTDSGRNRWGDVLRIGYSTRLLARLGDYRSFRSGHDGLNEFLRDHHEDIDVDVEFVPKRRLDDAAHKSALKLRESVLIYEHAKKTKRLPRFNERGEFVHACDARGFCFSSLQKQDLLRPWVEDEVTLEVPATAGSLGRIARAAKRPPRW